jgi:hypothetical protein
MIPAILVSTARNAARKAARGIGALIKRYRADKDSQENVFASLH